jgi:hypothetical protein
VFLTIGVWIDWGRGTMLLVTLTLKSIDDELDALECHITKELLSGIYSYGINSIEGVGADST